MKVSLELDEVKSVNKKFAIDETRKHEKSEW